MTESGSPKLPRWLPPMNQVMKALRRVGIAFFSFHLISVPGRRTGRLRTTPVSPFAFDGRRYILPFGRTQWVKNAREAGWGILSRGRRRTKVALTEVVPPESLVIVHEFPRRSPVLRPIGLGRASRGARSIRGGGRTPVSLPNRPTGRRRGSGSGSELTLATRRLPPGSLNPAQACAIRRLIAAARSSSSTGLTR